MATIFVALIITLALAVIAAGMAGEWISDL